MKLHLLLDLVKVLLLKKVLLDLMVLSRMGRMDLMVLMLLGPLVQKPNLVPQLVPQLLLVPLLCLQLADTPLCD